MNVSELADRPPLRCFGLERDRPGTVCGQRALWMRPARHALEAQFFCDAHHRPDDVPIPDDAIFRRITLDVEVRMSAASLTIAVAHAEALARLEEAVRAIRGHLSVGRVTSVIGRQGGQASASERTSSRGARE